MTGGKIFKKMYGLPLVIIAIAIVFGLYVWYFVKGRGFMTIPLLPYFVIPIVLMVWLITYSRWTWAIGNQLYKYLSKKLSAHFSVFTAAVLTTLFTPILGLVLFFSKGLEVFLDDYNALTNSVIIVIIVVLVCVVIQHWLLAKFFRSVELGRSATPPDFFYYFSMLVVHPIGIIPFQNRVKRHFEINEIQ